MESGTRTGAPLDASSRVDADEWLGLLGYRAGSDITAGHGDVPADIVSCFSSRKAYIFFLEVNAQLLALLANRGRLDLFWVCFIDNTAGLAALAKGFSKESAVNNLLAFFWCLCAELGWFGHFEWVASKLNPADPVSRAELQSAIKYGAAFLQRVPGGYWQLLRQVATSMTLQQAMLCNRPYNLSSPSVGLRGLFESRHGAA